MKGFVKNVVGDKGFGFIRGEDGGEYFFHRQDFNGHWDDLIEDKQNPKMQIRVEFEPTESPKGLRGANVKRLDFPNGV